MISDTPPEGSKLDEILYAHRSETWSTGWNNDATEKARTAIKSLLLELVNEQYELSLTDIEKYEYQNKKEMVVISKTQLVKALEAL